MKMKEKKYFTLKNLDSISLRKRIILAYNK